MTDQPTQFPQPVELPVDERESALPLRAQLTRFVIAGGLSAIVDFGLLLMLDAARAGPHAGQGGLLRGRHDHGVPDQPALDLPGAPSNRRFLAVVLLYALTFALQVGLFSLIFTVLTDQGLAGSRSR